MSDEHQWEPDPYDHDDALCVRCGAAKLSDDADAPCPGEMPRFRTRCLRRCPACQQMTDRVEVHGHTQCQKCGRNIEPCCSGERAD
jgi:hypothetical protein